MSDSCLSFTAVHSTYSRQLPEKGRGTVHTIWYTFEFKQQQALSNLHQFRTHRIHEHDEIENPSTTSKRMCIQRKSYFATKDRN